MVDAIAIALSTKGCETLLNEAAAIQFVMDAFGHLKAIGATAAAKPLLDKAGIGETFIHRTGRGGVVPLNCGFVEVAGKRYWDREVKIRLLA